MSQSVYPLARTTLQIAGDCYNAKDYGLRLDGSEEPGPLNDLMATAPGGATIYLPQGGWNGVGFNCPAGKYLFWRQMGTLDYGTAAPGTSPVSEIGDGHVTEAFIGGTLYHNKTIINAADGYAITASVLKNHSGPGNKMTGVVSNQLLTSYSAAGAVGFTWGHNNVLYSGATGGDTSQDVCGASGVYMQFGSNSVTFQNYAFTTDLRGLRGYNESGPQTGMIGIERDFAGYGPEAPGTAWGPKYGNRLAMKIGINQLKRGDWTAGAQVAVGTLINPAAQPGFVYYAASGGTTGATAPLFPASVGASVDDNGVVWTCGTEADFQFSRVLEIAAGPGASVGTAINLLGRMYGAVIDSTHVTFDHPDCAVLRMAAGQPIDLSSNLGLNKHTISCDPATGNYQYLVGGKLRFAVTQDGTPIFPNLPASPAGLAAGSLWRNGTAVNVV